MATIIVPIRVVQPEFAVFLENFRHSVGSLTQQLCEVVISDYGSAPEFAYEIRYIAWRCCFKYVYTPATDWSRGHALNAGLALATEDRVFMVDADMVLPLTYVQDHLRFACPDNYTVSRFYDSLEKENKSGNIDELLAFPHVFREPGWSHISVDRSWLTEHGGYGTEFMGYGAEDDALNLRMQQAGLKAIEIMTRPVHLWHPHYGELMASVGRREDYDRQLAENRRLYAELKQ
jgi:hypothetical protein